VREISGSSLEREDDERTWDEATSAVPPWEDDDAAGWSDEDEELDADVDASLREAWARRRALETEASAIEARLAARPAPPSGAVSFDPDLERLEEIDAALDLLPEPPSGWTPAPAPPEAPRAPVRPSAPTPFEAALRARLTEPELQQWRWIEEGRKQAAIAQDLGISQPAVAQREQKLRAKVDAIYRELTGKPYPWPGGPGKSRRLGARGPHL
jgi:DNA-binding CsgD family transcriptional regulator